MECVKRTTIISDLFLLIIYVVVLSQVREDVPIGFVVGAISAKDSVDAENLISNSDGLHITYTLTSLTSDVIEDAFDMDRNTGSLVVARSLDREQQSEYRLEIRALDTTASNNPQSSAVTVKVEIVDVNDNPPTWMDDPIIINIVENTAIGTAVYNFTAFDSDAGSNGDIQYKLLKQMPTAATETFAVDPLTGTLSLLTPVDYEQLTEYQLVVEAIDQSHNVTERLSTSVTARVLIVDANDNAPVFVSPGAPDSLIQLSDASLVGQMVTHIVAVDSDSGENGRVTYALLSGNEDEFFSIDVNSGFVELLKPLASMSEMVRHHRYGNSALTNGKYTLMISASDNGVPVPRETRISLQIVVQGSSSNPPRFLEPVYYANISENIATENFVVRVSAKNFQPENSEYIFHYVIYDFFTIPIYDIVSWEADF